MHLVKPIFCVIACSLLLNVADSKPVSEYVREYARDGFSVLAESERDPLGLAIFPRLTAAKLNELRDLVLRSPHVPKSLHSRQGQCQV
jgi:hypothetical protein